MPLFPTAYDSDNVSIGPCLVYFDGAHLGHTYGGTSVSITQNVYEMKSDQYGEVPIRVLDAGIMLEITCNLTESTFDNLKVMFSTATEVPEDAGPPVVPAHLTFGKPVGGSITTGILTLEPTDGSEAIQVYKAAPNINNAIEIGFTTDNQRVYAVRFVGLIDDTRDEGDQLFRIGNPILT